MHSTLKRPWCACRPSGALTYARKGVASTGVSTLDKGVQLLDEPLRNTEELLVQELDVDTEMARGLLPGALALSGKVMPAVTSVAHRTANAFREFIHDPQARHRQRGITTALVQGIATCCVAGGR